MFLILSFDGIDDLINHKANDDEYTEQEDAKVYCCQYLVVSINDAFLHVVGHSLWLLNHKVLVLDYALHIQHDLAHAGDQVDVSRHRDQYHDVNIHRVIEPLIHEEDNSKEDNAERTCIKREDWLSEFR